MPTIQNNPPAPRLAALPDVSGVTMRHFALLLLFSSSLALAEFGTGQADFDNLVVPLIDSAPEPTIGIPWTTDHIFYHAGSTTIRFKPQAPAGEQWADVTPPYQVPVNLDPMLVVHEETGRMLAGGLLGACSVMMISDDDGETWLPTANMCSGAQFDHQSVGLGVKPGLGAITGTAFDLNGYYCGQLGQIGCSVSLDGGVTWTAPSPVLLSNCGGFHGHWRTNAQTGEAFLPVGSCGAQHGMIVPSVALEAGGVTGLLFEERLVEGSHTWTGGFDPSVGISRPSGVLYYGMADSAGARIAISEDNGETWEKLGPNADTTWLDVGQFHEPRILHATFADVQAGDDDRAAFSFIGLEATGNPLIDRHLRTNAVYSCYDKGEGTSEWGAAGFPLKQSDMVWHYYVAFTFDRGVTWEVRRISEDPVQIGGVYDSLTDDSGGCRNLLDFNDMDIDSQGRVHIAYADGCTGDCASAAPAHAPGRSGYRDQAPRLFRQVGGRGLFAAYDKEASAASDDSESPAPGAGAEGRATEQTAGGVTGWLLLIGLAVLGLGRRQAAMARR